MSVSPRSSRKLTALFCALSVLSVLPASAGPFSFLRGDKEAKFKAAEESWCGQQIADARAGLTKRRNAVPDIDVLVRIADLERLQGRYQAANKALDQASEISRANLKNVDGDAAPRIQKVVAVYYAKGNLLRSQREFQSAEKAFRDAKDAGKYFLKPEDPLLVRSSAAVASMMATRGDLEQAHQLCVVGADQVITHIGSNDLEVAWIDEIMGFKFAGVESYADALKVYRHQLGIRETSLPPEHPDLADTHNRIASLQFELGRKEEAIAHLEKALDIRLRAFGEKHPFTLRSRENIKKAKKGE
jgi:tetratricopeptide (TPR) repeat protein